jgi:hypothetical protein
MDFIQQKLPFTAFRQSAERGLNQTVQSGIRAVLDMKQRNPMWRLLALWSTSPWLSLYVSTRISSPNSCRALPPIADGGEPFWLTFIGHAKDAAKLDLFRCESVALRTLGRDGYGSIHSANYRVRNHAVPGAIGTIGMVAAIQRDRREIVE